MSRTDLPVRLPPTTSRARGRVRGRRLAFAAVLLALLVAVRVASPSELRLPAALQDGITLATSVIVESLPFVILGVLVSVVVQVWLPQGLLLRVLPSRGIPRRIALSFLGVLFPVCECGNVPLARGLIASGLRVPEAVTFLLAAPILNPITIVTTFQAFGLGDGILLARVLGGFVIANLVGALVSRHPDPESLLTSRFRNECAVDEHDRVESRWRRSIDLFVRETAGMAPALVVGSAVAGAIQVALSREALVALGQNPLVSVLALMGLAFVVALCSTVDAFFALSLASSFLPGAIVAFLVFGPMVDVKMLALLRTTFTARALVTMVVVVALASAVLGLAVNTI